ncbi:hypothetical protein JCM5350_007096 [Sporobolomyces pararoseus]
MTSFYLPNELLESIFDFIHDKTAEPTPMSRRTFASLALTSKQFLPLARSHLYYRPIFNVANHSWHRALALASSLSILGHLVVSLEGIVDFVSRIGNLNDPSTSLPFQLRGFTKTFSLYYKMLNSCTNLVSVELIFNSKQHLSKLFQALKPSSSSLKTVAFKNSAFSTKYRASVELVQAALRRAEVRNIENLVIQRIGTIDSGEPSTTLSLKSVQCMNLDASLAGSKTFLPTNASSLTTFTIKVRFVNQQSLNWIFNYLPVTVQNISVISYNPHDDYVPGIDNYETTTTSSIPLPVVSRFTSLRRLALKGFNGPSLAHLEALATSSPNLLRLDFSDSCWIRSPGSSSSPIFNGSSISLLADPEDLLLQLEKIEKLEYVHLGYLPTLKWETYQDLEERMKAKGVEVKWKVCKRFLICPFCVSDQQSSEEVRGWLHHSLRAIKE